MKIVEKITPVDKKSCMHAFLFEDAAEVDISEVLRAVSI